MSLNYDPAVSAVAERFAAGKVITKKEAQYVTSFSFYVTLFLYFCVCHVFSFWPHTNKILANYVLHSLYFLGLRESVCLQRVLFTINEQSDIF